MNSTHGKNKRIVADSMGEMEVEADALYGAQTQRASYLKSIPPDHAPKMLGNS